MNCSLLDGAMKYKASDKKSLLHKKFSIKNPQQNVDFVTFTKKCLIENFIFVFNGLNNLSLLIYFQCHYYLIYCDEDIRITKKIYFNLNSHHNKASFQTTFKY